MLYKVLFALTACIGIVNSSEYFDVSEKYLIKHNLYEDKEGNLYFLKHKSIFIEDKIRFKQIYRKRFNSKIVDESISPLLGDVIDKDSWRQITTYFFRDKNEVYCTSPYFMDLSLIRMENINAKKLQILFQNQWVGEEQLKDYFRGIFVSNKNEVGVLTKDENAVYFRCSKIEGANPARFRVFVESSTIGSFGLDGSTIFRNNSKTSVSEVNEIISDLRRTNIEENNDIADRLSEMLNNVSSK